ncbi:MAG: hypothetical protein ACYS47_19665, partial [Planctomycetota bacterium]
QGRVKETTIETIRILDDVARRHGLWKKLNDPEKEGEEREEPNLAFYGKELKDRPALLAVTLLPGKNGTAIKITVKEKYGTPWNEETRKVAKDILSRIRKRFGEGAIRIK